MVSDDLRTVFNAGESLASETPPVDQFTECGHKSSALFFSRSE
jgi:hypothetical protein